MRSNVAEKVKGQVDTIKGAYEQGRQSAVEFTQTAAASSKEAAQHADEWVHDNSWKLLGMTLVVGLILGLVLSRGSTEPPWERLPR